MKIGILECEDTLIGFENKFPNYCAMFSQLFNKVSNNIICKNYAVRHGQWPLLAHECDAWLITGSRFGVYESQSWIQELEQMIRWLYKEKCKIFGVCFGHQLLAQALGGEVEYSKKGWGSGSVTTQLYSKPNWMSPVKKELTLFLNHQDQIVKLPESAVVIAGHDFCPYYILQYGQQCLSVQGHPEFTVEYVKSMIHKKKKEKLMSDTTATQALRSCINAKDEGDIIAQWMLNFIEC